LGRLQLIASASLWRALGATYTQPRALEAPRQMDGRQSVLESGLRAHPFAEIRTGKSRTPSPDSISMFNDMSRPKDIFPRRGVVDEGPRWQSALRPLGQGRCKPLESDVFFFPFPGFQSCRKSCPSWMTSCLGSGSLKKSPDCCGNTVPLNPARAAMCFCARSARRAANQMRRIADAGAFSQTSTHSRPRPRRRRRKESLNREKSNFAAKASKLIRGEAPSNRAHETVRGLGSFGVEFPRKLPFWPWLGLHSGGLPVAQGLGQVVPTT